MKHIIVRSSWQTVNIGDIGHTPGILKLLKNYFPDIKITLWASSINNGVDKILNKRFPDVDFVIGNSNENHIKKLFDDADFFLHGSGPYVVEQQDLQDWYNQTKKPFGIYGVTLEKEKVDNNLIDLLNHAEFIFLRDSISENYLLSLNIKCPVIKFSPDAAFNVDLKDDVLGNNYLKENNLVKEKFICAIPRLRYTPYFLIHNYEPSKQELIRQEINDKYEESDHNKLLAVVNHSVKSLNLKVLVCPEMTYEVELSKKNIIDKLDDKIKSKVVWRDNYWSISEAISIYASAKIIVTMELHSAIFAIREGVPAIYLHLPTDTCKGEMWRDIGLSEWIFELNDIMSDDIIKEIQKINNNYIQALEKVKNAMEIIKEKQELAMNILKNVL